MMMLMTVLSYFTDLQGSQTLDEVLELLSGLVTLLIYKVLKQSIKDARDGDCLVTLLIYKVLKPKSVNIRKGLSLVTLLIYKVLKQVGTVSV